MIQLIPSPRIIDYSSVPATPLCVSILMLSVEYSDLLLGFQHLDSCCKFNDNWESVDLCGHWRFLLGASGRSVAPEQDRSHRLGACTLFSRR